MVNIVGFTLYMEHTGIQIPVGDEEKSNLFYLNLINKIISGSQHMLTHMQVKNYERKIQAQDGKIEKVKCKKLVLYHLTMEAAHCVSSSTLGVVKPWSYIVRIRNSSGCA